MAHQLQMKWNAHGITSRKINYKRGENLLDPKVNFALYGEMTSVFSKQN